ncbi:MAG: LytTR family DNA-binding domain-containing protein [Acidobacteriota bacterium]
MTTIRVLVVDDEKPGRERLRRLLAREPRARIVGCCGGGAEAIEIVKRATRAGEPIQLMFLDVQMPEVDGFAVCAALEGDTALAAAPAVVFVTAHDEYALRAFDANAIDYLLKPFSDERFQAAFDRAMRDVQAGHAHALISRMQHLLSGPAASSLAVGAGPSPRPVLDRIVIRGPGRVRLLPVDQISWIEAEGMYVTIHTRDGSTHLHRGLLGSLDESLDGRHFVRIHRSAIVNIDVVVELRQDAHGDYVAVLRDKTELPVGRRFRSRLQERLGQTL